MGYVNLSIYIGNKKFYGWVQGLSKLKKRKFSDLKIWNFTSYFKIALNHIDNI